MYETRRPEGAEGDGAHSPYEPMGAPRISYASPPYSGALALKLAVDVLDGKDVPQHTTLPLPLVTNDTIELCETGSWDEQQACLLYTFTSPRDTTRTRIPSSS